MSAHYVLSTVLTMAVILSPILQMRKLKPEEICSRLDAVHGGSKIRSQGVWLEPKHYASKG